MTKTSLPVQALPASMSRLAPPGSRPPFSQMEVSELYISAVAPREKAPPGIEVPFTLMASDGRFAAGNQTLRLVSYASHSLPLSNNHFTHGSWHFEECLKSWTQRWAATSATRGEVWAAAAQSRCKALAVNTLGKAPIIKELAHRN